VREVAARLGVSTATVYKLVNGGALAHVRIANSIRVAPADLAAYLKGLAAAGGRA
jgi:excisionase family DNA binding protein